MITVLAVAALLAGLFVPGPLAAQTFTAPWPRRSVRARRRDVRHFSVESADRRPAHRAGRWRSSRRPCAGRGKGLFLASGSGITKVTVEGDPAPGGGTISGLGRHPVPALNADGTVAFAASVARGKTVEGLFIASRGRIQAVALAGAVAPGIASGTLAGFDGPALNDRGDIAFMATVRRGRETVEAIYYRAAGKQRTAGTLTKLVAQGDPAPPGRLRQLRSPLNNQGSVVFAADRGPGRAGGIFRAGGASQDARRRRGTHAARRIFMKFSSAWPSTTRASSRSRGAAARPVAAAVLRSTTTGAKVVATGDGAPGGGTFTSAVTGVRCRGHRQFVASVDAGPSPVGASCRRPVFESRLSHRCPAAGLATFTLYPVITLSQWKPDSPQPRRRRGGVSRLPREPSYCSVAPATAQFVS
jgi:hypothetical protein